MEIIRAGAGEAPIHFGKNVLPTPGENYTGVHDDPDVHVLCFSQKKGEKEEVCVFMGLNLVSYPDTEELQKLAAKRTGAKAEHVLVHCNHNLSTPHGAMRMETEEEIRFADEYGRIVRAAAENALTRAWESMQPAEIRFYTAKSNVNVSRVLELKDGLWQGTNEAGETDHTVPVIRVDGKETGTCTAIFFAVNMAPGVMEGSLLENGGRLISGDIAGAAERNLKKLYPGAVCCYCLGASGDQWQELRAVADVMNAQGELEKEDLHEKGFVLVETLGRKLASSISIAIRKPAEPEENRIEMETRNFVYPGQKELGRDFNSMRPGKVEFEAAGDVNSDTAILKLGDIAVVAAHAEINAASLQRIRAAAKCEKIFFTAFTNGAGGYMTEKAIYDAGGYQCRKSQFFRGSAELFEKNVAAFLEDMM